MAQYFRNACKIFFTPLILTGLVACSGQKLRMDLDQAEQSINDLRSFQAEQTTQIESLRNEIRTLTGRLDLIEHTNSNQLGTDLTNLRNDLSTLKKRVPPPAGVPVEQLEADEVLAGSLPEEMGKLFSDALQKIREGQFDNAVPVLRNTLDLSYGKDWSANVLFWLGVTYEFLSDNRNALASYNEITTRFTKHPRAPLALFRQSDVLGKIGDKATAKLSFKKLIADYPKSREAALAKDKLKNL
jgi:TolA-binding protein